MSVMTIAFSRTHVACYFDSNQATIVNHARDVWSPTPVSAIPHSTHCPCSHRGSCYIIMHACRLSTVGDPSFSKDAVLIHTLQILAHQSESGLHAINV